MVRCWVLLATIFAVIFGVFSSVSTSPTIAEIVAPVVSKVFSALASWIWSINSTSKYAFSTRSMIKFEAGYVVETVFDGSKLGIEPYSIEVTPSGELLILDAENSNIHKLSMPFSQFCRPKLFSGSFEGYSGHVDGKLRDARMSHPKGLTVDERGNIYIADTKNMAIRKISDAGVTTIAGGKWRRSGHVDGPSEDAKFSNDFDVVYVGSSCSLLVIDRGNQAIREIQLRADDCANKYDDNFLLGMAVLTAAGFFGYMLAHLQWRVSAMFSSKNDSRADSKKVTPMSLHQRPQKSIRHPFIPGEEEDNQPGDNIICSLGKLFLNTGSSAAEIFVGLVLGTRRKHPHDQIQHQYQVNKHPRSWLGMEESFATPHNPNHDDLPPIASDKRYPYMATRLQKSHHIRHGRGANDSGWDDGNQWEESQWEQQQYHERHYSSSPKMYFNQSSEKNEVVFGQVQEEEQLHD